MTQQWLLTLSAAALGLSVGFLAIGVSVILKFERPKKWHAYLFFSLAVLMLLLFSVGSHASWIPTNQGSGVINTIHVNNGILPFWLSALGTLSLALITFIIAIIIPWRRKPKFTIKFDNKGPFCTTADEPPQSYWLRVKVTNSGKSAAKSCVGRLVQFTDINKNLIDREPVRLHWVGTPWAPLELLAPIDLNRGDSVFLDVLLTKADSPSKAFLFTNALVTGAQLARAQLVKTELAWSQLDELPPGTCRIRIAIYGDNVEPCAKEYSISWDDSNYTAIRLEEK
jgi:hypothetical protein